MFCRVLPGSVQVLFVFQVNFEEFKNGLVVVLSHSLDFSTSEDDSSYLEPGETLQDPVVSGSGSGPAR